MFFSSNDSLLHKASFLKPGNIIIPGSGYALEIKGRKFRILGLDSKRTNNVYVKPLEPCVYKECDTKFKGKPCMWFTIGQAFEIIEGLSYTSNYVSESLKAISIL
jgi:hypothetical protein